MKMKGEKKMNGIKPKANSPKVSSGNMDVIVAARKGRKCGGKTDMKVKGSMAAARADRPGRSLGGKLETSDWKASQGEPKMP